MKDGILLLDKPVGPTSNRVLGTVRRWAGTRKVGHTGTLDPLASGLLPVVIGRATRIAPFLTLEPKRYDTTLRFGVNLGCLTSRRDWPTRPAVMIPGAVLDQALAHAELRVTAVAEDELRPRFRCAVIHEENHRPFHGFNRAQAAVVEAAILVSRLHMLAPEKIEREIAYLQIAIDKTAGPREQQAWAWLMERIAEHRARTETERRA